MSAGPAGGGAGRRVPAPAPPPPGSRVEGAGWTRVPPAALTARLVGCRCWCRSWSSTRSVLRGARRARPAASPPCPLPTLPGPLAQLPPRPTPPPPARPAARVPPPGPRGGHSCACRAFAVAAEEVGLGGQRAQQELRGIGEIFDISIPVFPSTRSPPPCRGSCSWGEVAERCSGATPGERDSLGRFCFVLGRPGLFWEETALGGGWREVGATLRRGLRWGGSPGAAAYGESRGRACARTGWGGGRCQPLSELLSSFCFRTRLVTRPLIGVPSFAPPSSSNHLFPRNRIVGF